MKRTILFLTLFLTVAFSAYATQAYLQGTGLPVWMTQDESLGITFPSLLSDFKNEFAVDYNSTASQTAGNLNFPLYGNTLSLLFNKQAQYSLFNGGEFAWTGAMYSFNAGKSPAGAGIFFSSNLNATLMGKLDNPVNKGGNQTLSADSNVGAAYGMKFGSIDAAITIIDMVQTGEDNKTYNPAGWLSNSAKDVTDTFLVILNQRTMNGSWIFNATETGGLGNENSLTQTYNAGGTVLTKSLGENSNKYLDVGLGTADVIKSGDKLSFTIGATAEYFLIDEYTKNSDITGLLGTGDSYDSYLLLPVYIATEVKLNDIFTLRTGGNMYITQMEIASIDTKDPSGKILTKITGFAGGSGSGQVNFGGSAKLGDFNFDAAIDYAFLLAGPYFISGSSNDLSYTVGVTYAWK